MSHSHFLTTAITAARLAEPIILQHFADTSVGMVSYKPDRSPVTLADKAAEAIIANTIKTQFPDHQLLGEESGHSGDSSRYQWVIDPIDGTKNYVRGVPVFSTEIALLHQGQPLVGVSNALGTHTMLYAEQGNGAFCNDLPIHVSSVNSIDQAYVVFGGLKYFGQVGAIDGLLKLSSDAGSCRGFGDFWNYHLLAQGKVDVVVEAVTHIWDIAALICIVAVAGGMVTDFDGQPISQETTSIVATNGVLHQETIGYFNQMLVRQIVSKLR